MPHAPNRRALLQKAFEAAVDAADPQRILPAHLPAPPAGDLLVLGAGKAAAAMARAVESHYRSTAAWGRLRGLVITRYGHAEATERVEVVEAGHPVPDEAGAAATRRVLELARSATADDLVLVLVSGGGSALLTAPDGIDLEGKRKLTEALLGSGATIQEMNTVRRHLSAVKGGRLAAAAHPARLVALAISDVVGDDPAAIASGPTVGDPTTFADALAVLNRYAIPAPDARSRLEAGARGEVAETPSPGALELTRTSTHVVASGQQSLEAAAAVLDRSGYPPAILASGMTGEAREIGAAHAAIATQVATHGQPRAAPCAILSGGETTVTIRGSGGRGGRNAEFALGFALALPEPLLDDGRVHGLAADTDGIDGTEDNAGAFVDAALFAANDRTAARGALERNDAWSVFAAADALLTTGPTRTNVNDLRMMLIDPATGEG